MSMVLDIYAAKIALYAVAKITDVYKRYTNQWCLLPTCVNITQMLQKMVLEAMTKVTDIYEK
jgi:hypothetical protein